MLLPKKWRKKFAFLSPHVRRPGKAFLDRITISKLYPWAKTNIKCLNRRTLACERPPVCHTAASNITHSPIADQDSSHVQHACCTLYSSVGQRALHSSLHCCTAVCRGGICIVNTGTALSVARTFALLHYSFPTHAQHSTWWLVTVHLTGHVCSVVRRWNALCVRVSSCHIDVR